MRPCATRTDVVITADPSRVLARLFVPGHELSREGRSRGQPVGRQRRAGVVEQLVATEDLRGLGGEQRVERGEAEQPHGLAVREEQRAVGALDGHRVREPADDGP